MNRESFQCGVLLCFTVTLLSVACIHPFLLRSLGTRLCLIEVSVTGECPSCSQEGHLNISGISYKLQKCNVWHSFHILFVWVNTRGNLMSNIKCENVSRPFFFLNNTWMYSSNLSFSNHPNKTFSSWLLWSVVGTK